MYIIEWLIDYLRGKKYTARNKYDPLNVTGNELVEDSENCEHLFMPIDSTNEMFACKYCGLLVPKDKLKNNKIN